MHTATDLSLEHAASTDILNHPQSRKIVQGLIDLVILEGIYPALSPGIGVPIEKRLKSIMKGGLVAKPSEELRIPETDRQFLLVQIVDALVPIVLYNGPTSVLVKERMMVDLIAALGDLAYSPLFRIESKDSFISMLDDLFKRSVHYQPCISYLHVLTRGLC